MPPVRSALRFSNPTHDVARRAVCCGREFVLWGAVGCHGVTRGYVSAPELERAMAAYNQVLLAVCREDRLECYDMAAVIPKDTCAFSDESHYNDNGARLVADYLAERLLGFLSSQWNQRGDVGGIRSSRKTQVAHFGEDVTAITIAANGECVYCARAPVANTAMEARPF